MRDRPTVSPDHPHCNHSETDVIKLTSHAKGTSHATSENSKSGKSKSGNSKNGNSKNGEGKKSKNGRTTSATPSTVKLTFVLAPDAATGSVSVLGDFNHWDPLAHPLKRRSNGTRSVSVEVPAGSTVAFKYLDESGRWFCDPDLPEAAVNEYGETNSIVTT